MWLQKRMFWITNFSKFWLKRSKEEKISVKVAPAVLVVDGSSVWTILRPLHRLKCGLAKNYLNEIFAVRKGKIDRSFTKSGHLQVRVKGLRTKHVVCRKCEFLINAWVCDS